jgi:hypothetical protein
MIKRVYFLFPSSNRRLTHHLSINIVMGEKGLKLQEITSLSKKMASIFCEIYFLLCNVLFMGSKTI